MENVLVLLNFISFSICDEISNENNNTWKVASVYKGSKLDYVRGVWWIFKSVLMVLADSQNLRYLHDNTTCNKPIFIPRLQSLQSNCFLPYGPTPISGILMRFHLMGTVSIGISPRAILLPFGPYLHRQDSSKPLHHRPNEFSSITHWKLSIPQNLLLFLFIFIFKFISAS